MFLIILLIRDTLSVLISEDGSSLISCERYDITIELHTEVKRIESESLSYCPNLYSLYISSKVEFIDRRAFSPKINIDPSISSIKTCSKLVYIDVPPGNSHFSSYDNVLYNKDQTVLIRYPPGDPRRSFRLNDNVEEIYPNAFLGAKNLKEILISKESVLSVVGELSIAATDVSSFVFPKSLTTVKDFAFFLSPIKYVIFQENLVNVGLMPFSQPTDVLFKTNHRFVFQDGVLYDSDKRSIICITDKLRNYIVPCSVTDIRKFAFANFQREISLEFSPCSPLDTIEDFTFYNSRIVIKSLPKNLKRIGDLALNPEYTMIDTIEISKKLEYVGNNTLFALSSTKRKFDSKIYNMINNSVYMDNKQVLVRVFPDLCTKTFQIPHETKVIRAYAFVNCKDLVTVTLNSELLQIQPYAFFNCTSLEHVIIPDSSKLEYIGKSAFQFTKLANITIPKNVGVIEDYAFDVAANLSRVIVNFEPNCTIRRIGNNNCTIDELPSSLEHIDTNSPYLSSITNVSEDNEHFVLKGGSLLSKNLTILYSMIDYGHGTVTVPETVQIISSNSMRHLKNVTNLKISNSVMYIEPNSLPKESKFFLDLDSNSSLTIMGSQHEISLNNRKIVFPKNFRQGHAYMFGMTDSIKDVVSNSNLEYLGSGIFLWCHISKFEIPMKLTYLSSECFDKSLEHFSGTSRSYEVYDDVLYYENRIYAVFCSKINTEINLYEGVRVIKSRCFQYCFIKELEIPASVEIIEADAFEGCEIKKLYFKADSRLNIIENNALSGKIKEVYLPSSIKYIGKDTFLSETKYVFPEKLDYFVRVNKTIFTPDMKTIVEVESGNSVYHVEEGVTTISNGAFRRTQVEKIVVSSTVESIGDYAFSECYILTEVVFQSNSSLKIIGTDCFSGTKITQITLPESLVYLVGTPFKQCSELEKIDASQTQLQVLRSNNIHSCGVLSYIYLPASVRLIESHSINNCGSLQKIVIYRCDENVVIDKDAYTAFSSGTPSFIYCCQTGVYLQGTSNRRLVLLLIVSIFVSYAYIHLVRSRGTIEVESAIDLERWDRLKSSQGCHDSDTP